MQPGQEVLWEPWRDRAWGLACARRAATGARRAGTETRGRQAGRRPCSDLQKLKSEKLLPAGSMHPLTARQAGCARGQEQSPCEQPRAWLR